MGAYRYSVAGSPCLYLASDRELAWFECGKGFVSISVDEQDKRKQRIELTSYCREFCEKNDEMSMALMKRMFEGVSEEQLQTTIQTIIQIEDNLKEIRDYE